MLLRLLILNSLIYANTYDTKAENTLHSTDRHATAEYREKHKRFRLLKEGIKAVVVCCILYCLWQYSSSYGQSLEVQTLKKIGSEFYMKEECYIKCPWNKTIEENEAQFKLCSKNSYDVFLYKEYATLGKLKAHIALNETGIVPKILGYRKFDPSEKAGYCCIMEYPFPIEDLIEKTKALINGLKNIKYKNIGILDMVEGCFLNFDQVKDRGFRWYHYFYNGGKHSREEGEKEQIRSFAIAVLVDVYYEIIRSNGSLKEQAESKNNLLLEEFQKKTDEELSTLIENIETKMSIFRITRKLQKQKLFGILKKVICEKIENLDTFLEEIKRIELEELEELERRKQNIIVCNNKVLSLIK